LMILASLLSSSLRLTSVRNLFDVVQARVREDHTG
jgi:hypothetical protein